MPIFQVTPEELKELSQTTFGAENIMERKDIQRLLREQISVLDEHFMVIAEEFGDWLDSSRRIDLLCLDSDANLVVVELKRTEDGGLMEVHFLQ
jgi:RecB family endonuclease NucS